MRLYCIPHAGGSARFFQPWVMKAPPFLEIAPIELPGRMARFSEPLITDLHELVTALHSALGHEVRAPFAVFGHSLGALVAFEWARRLVREDKIPLHFFACGRQAPTIPSKDPVGAYSDEALIDYLKSTGGLGPEVLGEPELLELLLPIIRSDVKLAEGYRYTEGEPLPCALSAFGATGESQTEDEIRAWSRQSSAAFDHAILEGDHFVAFDQAKGIFPRIVATLDRYRRDAS